MQFANAYLMGELLQTPGISSPNYVTGVSGWRIGQDGSAEFNNAVIRGNISGSAAYATTAGLATDAQAVHGVVVSRDTTAASSNYTVNGQLPGTGWSIDRMGNAVFNNITSYGNASGPGGAWDNLVANVTFKYRGLELQGLLNTITNQILAIQAALPLGIIAWGNLPNTAGPYPAGNLVRVGMFYIGTPMRTGRTYRLSMSPILLNANVIDASCNMFINYTTDGSVPSATPGGSTIQMQNVPWVVPQYYQAATFDLIFTVPTSATWNFLFGLDTTGTNHPTALTASIPGSVTVTIEDLGPSVALNSLHNTFVAPPPPPPAMTQYNISQRCTRSNAYKGDGSIMTNANGHLFQGTDPSGYNGTQSSDAFFDGTGANTLTLLHSTGCGNGNLQYMRVFFYWEHWYYNAGGVMRLGYVDSASGYHLLGDYNVGPANAAIMADLVGSLAQVSILNGNFVGFTLGYQASCPAGDENFYGYSAGTGDPNAPLFEAGWLV